MNYEKHDGTANGCDAAFRIHFLRRFSLCADLISVTETTAAGSSSFCLFCGSAAAITTITATMTVAADAAAITTTIPAAAFADCSESPG